MNACHYQEHLHKLLKADIQNIINACKVSVSTMNHPLKVFVMEDLIWSMLNYFGNTTHWKATFNVDLGNMKYFV